MTNTEVTDKGWAEQTRKAYDQVADDYAQLLRTELAQKPLDRSLLSAFIELAGPSPEHPIADLGCGPGRVAGYLNSLGAEVFGIDLSPGMIAAATRDHPGLRFEVGTMTALDIADSSVSGIVAWYSIIHLPPDELPGVFAEFARILVPGGPIILAFQVGNEVVHLEQGYGHPLSLDAYRLSPERISDLLSEAGFKTASATEREPIAPEKNRQAYLIANLER
ncbi:methyltransferase domain-containing protein [Saxibacter everestensis]|uniref:Methyltransferase domain-containing protein n=1 Tax=Saxibacter everestensis TaxID=2909229 RepID=A0ABY8QTB9_9MICO|nr:methyltransferase domain-containing protein [Brevibacteriaceae bacterium ZFBP1038]